MAAATNVIPLMSSDVSDQVERFYIKKGRKSTDTLLAYKKDIEDFFLFLRNKEMCFLQEKDLTITLDDFEDYITHLEGRELKNVTINRKVQAVKSLLSFLKLKYPFIDTSYFKHVENLPDDTESYDALSLEEVLKMADLAKQEREKKLVKHYFILFALDTCIRKTALLKLKWTDFQVKSDVVVVKGIDKGNKKFRKEISLEFYEELLIIKENSETVFNISSDAVDSMMQRLKKKMNLQNRKIVFHSIRKAGGTFAFRMTGDILEAKKALGHEDINTTFRYLQERDYGATGAVSMSQNLNLSIINTVSHEDLLSAIGECGQDVKMLLAKKLLNMKKSGKKCL